MSYLIRRVLAKPRLILEEMCRSYGKFASYLRRVLCRMRLIFPRINGPIVVQEFALKEMFLRLIWHDSGSVKVIVQRNNKLLLLFEKARCIAHVLYANKELDQ